MNSVSKLGLFDLQIRVDSFTAFMEQPPDYYKKLAEKALNIENIDIKNHPKVRAEVFVDEKLLASGAAEISSDEVVFFPNTVCKLQAVPRGSISIKVGKSQLPLSQSTELFDSSSERMWFFAINKDQPV
jgi:hypothetical protein